ncbi:MAG: TIGR02996 domain-containing protein [Gemmataceae bacterium]|nr:TIGR02996 domain-containing protein [Gemmataceae bacterium]
MGDGEPLLRAVCEHPDDDTPRLVLADWLEENGEPERAAFIRLQCQAALSHRDRGRRRLEEQADRLLRLFSRRWAAELPHGAGYRWADVYSRGFQCTVMVDEEDAFLADLDEVFDAAPLTDLDVGSLLQFDALIDRGCAGRLRHILVASHNLDLLAADLCRLAAYPRLRVSVGMSYTTLGSHPVGPDTAASLTAAFGDRIHLPPAGLPG